MTDAEITALPEGPSWIRMYLLRAAAHEAETRSYELHALAELATPHSTDEERKQHADKATSLAALYRGLAAGCREQADKERAFLAAGDRAPAVDLTVEAQAGGAP